VNNGQGQAGDGYNGQPTCNQNNREIHEEGQTEVLDRKVLGQGPTPALKKKKTKVQTYTKKYTPSWQKQGTPGEKILTSRQTAGDGRKARL